MYNESTLLLHTKHIPCHIPFKWITKNKTGVPSNKKQNKNYIPTFCTWFSIRTTHILSRACGASFVLSVLDKRIRTRFIKVKTSQEIMA